MWFWFAFAWKLEILIILPYTRQPLYAFFWEMSIWSITVFNYTIYLFICSFIHLFILLLRIVSSLYILDLINPCQMDSLQIFLTFLKIFSLPSWWFLLLCKCFLVCVRQLAHFCFCFLCFRVLAKKKKIIPVSMSSSISPMLSSSSFIVPGPTFKS